jgi:acyl phosphate:glycerol-3-phosphate acyltransferase
VDLPLAVLIGVIVGYLAGGIPFGLIVGHIAGVPDLRDHGSGKTGFTNSLRLMGKRWAMLVVAGDITKGAAAVVFAQVILNEPWAAALAGVAAVLGHIFPPYTRFHGGRGVATAFGAFLAVSPIAALAVIAFSLVVLVIWRYASLMSVTGVFVGFLVVAALVATEFLPRPYIVFALLTMLAVELMHIENIRRLVAGTEPKLGEGGERRPPRTA